jgi:hypothetical protein
VDPFRTSSVAASGSIRAAAPLPLAMPVRVAVALAALECSGGTEAGADVASSLNVG